MESANRNSDFLILSPIGLEVNLKKYDYVAITSVTYSMDPFEIA